MLKMNLETLKYNLSKRFWKITEKGFSANTISYSKNKPFENAILPQDEVIKKSFEHDNSYWEHEQYIIELTNCELEPEYGSVITGLRKIYPKSRINSKLYPSINQYLKRKFAQKEKIDRAILFSVNLGGNYFHFFSDIVAKLWMYPQAELKKMPLLVSKQIYNSPLFQYLFQNSHIDSFNWKILDSEKIYKINKLLLLRPEPYSKTHWLQTISYFKLSKNKDRKIFLTRSKRTGRNLINIDEVEAFMQKNSIEVVETEDMSIQEQVKLFSEASLIIGIHGAGLTNIIFAHNNNPKIIEIIPENRIACQYYWISTMLDYDYTPILGTSLVNNEFSVSLNQLEDRI